MNLRRPRQVLALFFTVYAIAVFVLLGLLVVLCIIPVPSLRVRRVIVRAGSRSFLAAAGFRLRVLNAEWLPAEPCVLVANHASYLDGVIMKAALPPRFAFVIKREMNNIPVVGFLLRRIGSEFIDRGQGRGALGDARRILRTASTGASLVFFPEGTFEAEPGLMRFHSGAFVAAVRSGYPVVPAVIRGTRIAMPLNTLLAPGVIEVEIMPALSSAATTPEDAVRDLKLRARNVILARLNEPDLHPA